MAREMLAERRKAVRRIVQLPAKIDPGYGAPLRDCIVVDISDLGARVAVTQSQSLPNEFTILLAPFARPFRRCRLVWRVTDYVGVEFDADWQHRFQATLVDPIVKNLPMECP
jgi:PilZ domain